MTAWCIEVAPRPGAPDPTGDAARIDLAAAGIPVAGVASARCYLVLGALGEADIRRICDELLVDAVVETAAFGPHPGPLATPPPGTLVVTKRPGVMDPAEASVRRGIADLGLAAVAVRTGLRYRIPGLADATALRGAAERVLANPVVDEIAVGTPPRAAAVDPGPPSPPARPVPLRDLAPDALLALSKARALALDAAEMAAIRDHFRGLRREPTDVELETLAQTWSEHCKHKTLTAAIDGGDGHRYRNLLKETVFASTATLARPWCLSVFKDNAGVIAFDEDSALAVKVETHNHPSAIEPYGGAGTGSGGVIRDVLGTGIGARPILCTDTFGIASPDRTAPCPPGVLHPRRVLRGVVAGIRDYGNRMGIPTAAGGLLVHEGYLGSPLVFAGCVGVMPRHAVTKSVRPGDRIVVAGGRTGRDGIHGATFSSEALAADGGVVGNTAVQIGNAIAEKRLLEGVLRVRDLGLLRALTDCGAGGLSSAVGELGAETGADVELARVPLKYPGLAPAEVWVSEAQERMVLVVPPEHLAAAIHALAEEEVEATPIGQFTADHRLTVRWDGEVVADLAMAFLHDGLPRATRTARVLAPADDPRRPPPPRDPGAALLGLLGDFTVCSREWIVRQYDHEVQAGSVVKPFVGARAEGPGDGCMVRPDPRAHRGCVVTHGVNPRYGERDPYAMALAAIDEALRNAVALGADPAQVAILDNFVWGDVKDPVALGGLVRACEGCRDGALAYGTPFVSGKDSLNNTFVGLDGTRTSVPPTLLITAVAIVPDVRRAVTSDLKRAGNLLYVVGETRDELGGSLWHARHGCPGGRVPTPDLRTAPATLRAVAAATAKGLVRAAHDPSEGGLAVALAEMCLGGDCGAAVDLARLPAERGCDTTTLAFSESPTRLVCEVAPGDAAAFEAALAGVACARVGTVTSDGRLRCAGRDGKPWLDVAVADCRQAFRAPLYAVMGETAP